MPNFTDSSLIELFLKMLAPCLYESSQRYTLPHLAVSHIPQSLCPQLDSSHKLVLGSSPTYMSVVKKAKNRLEGKNFAYHLRGH